LFRTVRKLFLLDPDVVFLNHGSFGACPRPVFERYQEWQRVLEHRPLEFLDRRLPELMDGARAALAAEVGAASGDLVFAPNATAALNTVARSLRLEPGDEVLSTDHEYGALDLTWEFVCARAGARYMRRSVPVPVRSREEVVESVWSGVNDRTRVLHFSHITSRTAIVFPVAELCRRARSAGILAVVDGAHAPGQIPLDLDSIGADVYAGNCHKWLCAPKGAGFLWARPEHQRWIEPAVVSWGFEPDQPFSERSHWQGTRDPAAFLSVPAAIEFQREHDWNSVRDRCHELVREARRRLTEWTGLEPLTPDSRDWFVQMASLPLPPCNPDDVQRRLREGHRIEVPVRDWKGTPLVRVSVQGYNTEADVAALVEALPRVLGVSCSPTPPRPRPRRPTPRA
jgi:isopenicillin-N epimerase